MSLERRHEVALAYVLPALALAGAHRAARGRRQERRGPRTSARSRWVPAGVGALAAAIAIALLLRQPAPPREPTVTFLDVGQGDATLIQHPGGGAVLVDGGPPEARVYRLVREAGVRRLSAVIATHASRDHHGGLRELIEQIPVGLLLDGGDGTADSDFNALLETARERRVRVVEATAPLTLEAGGIEIRVLSPPARPAGPAPEDPNPRAVVALVESGELEVFLSADAESDALEPLVLPDVDVMKAPHHGSADPGLPGLLDRLRPEAAVIEVGENSYGHPAPETIGALREAVVPTFRTDRHGSVSLTGGGPDGLHVATER